MGTEGERLLMCSIMQVVLVYIQLNHQKHLILFYLTSIKICIHHSLHQKILQVYLFLSDLCCLDMLSISSEACTSLMSKLTF